MLRPKKVPRCPAAWTRKRRRVTEERLFSDVRERRLSSLRRPTAAASDRRRPLDPVIAGGISTQAGELSCLSLIRLSCSVGKACAPHKLRYPASPCSSRTAWAPAAIDPTIISTGCQVSKQSSPSASSADDQKSGNVRTRRRSSDPSRSNTHRYSPGSSAHEHRAMTAPA